MIRIATVVALGFMFAARSAAAQQFSPEPLRSDATLPADDLPATRAAFLAWLADSTAPKSASMLVPAREHLYALVSNDAKARYRTTGAAYPAAASPELAELYGWAARLGTIGAGAVAAAQVETPPPSVESLAGGAFELTFAPPEYTLVAVRDGWRVRFPHYFMIGTVQRSPTGSGDTTGVVMLSTLFAPNAASLGGASQATILLLSAESSDAPAFTAFWLDRFGLSPSDTAAAAIPGAVRRYTGFDAATRMRKEIVVFVPPGRVLLAAYVGLEGTFEANRPHFADLLATLQVRSATP